MIIRRVFPYAEKHNSRVPSSHVMYQLIYIFLVYFRLFSNCSQRSLSLFAVTSDIFPYITLVTLKMKQYDDVTSANKTFVKSTYLRLLRKKKQNYGIKASSNEWKKPFSRSDVRDLTNNNRLSDPPFIIHNSQFRQ